MALIDLIKQTCTKYEDIDVNFERELVTEPQKVDSPREILEKYARGLPIYGVSNPAYQSDEIDDDDAMLDSFFIDDDMDRRQFVIDFGKEPVKVPEKSHEERKEDEQDNSPVEEKSTV